MLSASMKYLSFFRKKSPDPETPISSSSFVTASEEDIGRYINADGKLTFARKIRRFSPFKTSRFFNMSSRRSAVSNWGSVNGECKRSTLFSMTEYERGEYHIQSAVEQFDEDHDVFDETARLRDEECWPPVMMSNEFGIHGPVEVLTLVNLSEQDLEIDLGNLPIDPFCTAPPEVLSMLSAMSSMDFFIMGPVPNMQMTNETSMQHANGSTSRATVTTTSVKKTSTRIVFEPKDSGPISERVPDGPSTSTDQPTHLNVRDRVIFSFEPPNLIRIYTLEYYHNKFLKRNYIANIDSTINPRLVGVSRSGGNVENASIGATSEPESPTFSRRSTAFATDAESLARLNEFPISSEHDARSDTVESEVDLDAALETAVSQNTVNASSNPSTIPDEQEDDRAAERRRAMFYSNGVLPNSSHFQPPAVSRPSEAPSMNGHEVAMLGNSSASESSGDSSSDLASQPSTRPGSSLLSPRSGTNAEAGMGADSSDSDGDSSDDSFSPPPSRSGSRLLSPSREAERFVRASENRVSITLANRNLRQVNGNDFESSVVPGPPQVLTAVNPTLVRLRSTNSTIRSSSESSSGPATPSRPSPDSRPSTPSRAAVDFIRLSGYRVRPTLLNRNLRLVPGPGTSMQTHVVPGPYQASPVRPDAGVRMRRRSSSTRSSGEPSSNFATPTRPGTADSPSTPSREAVRFVRSLEGSPSTHANRNLARRHGSRLQTSPLANESVTGVRMRAAPSEFTSPQSSGSDNPQLSPATEADVRFAQRKMNIYLTKKAAPTQNNRFQTCPAAARQATSAEAGQTSSQHLENTTGTSACPSNTNGVDEANGYDVDAAEELVRRLESLHTERVNEDSMVAQAGDVSLDNGGEHHPHSVPIPDIFSQPIVARVNSFVDLTERVARFSRFGVHSEQFYSDPPIDSIDVRTPAGAALRALIETTNRLDSEGNPSDRTRINELLTQSNEPEAPGNDSSETNQPSLPTAHQSQIIVVEEAPPTTQQHSESANVDGLAPITGFAVETDESQQDYNNPETVATEDLDAKPVVDVAQTASNLECSEVLGQEYLHESSLMSTVDAAPTAEAVEIVDTPLSTEDSPPTAATSSCSPEPSALSPAKDEEVAAAAKRMEVFLASKKKEVSAAGRFKTQQVDLTVKVTPTTESIPIVDASPDVDAASTPEVSPTVEATPTNDSPLPQQNLNQESTVSSSEDPPAMEVAQSAETAQIVNATSATDSASDHDAVSAEDVASIVVVTPDADASTSITSISASVSTPSRSSSRSRQRVLSPAKDDEIAAAAKRMEAFLASKNKTAAPTASCSTSAASGVENTPSVDAAPATETVVETPSDTDHSTPTPATSSCSPESNVLSPAKDQEVAAAAKRMEAFLASHQKVLPTASRFTTKQADPTTKTVSTVETTSDVEAAATADASSNAEIAPTARDQSENPEPDNVTVEPTSGPTPKSIVSCSLQSSQVELSPATDNGVAAAEVETSPEVTTTADDAPNTINSELTPVSAEDVASQPETASESTPSPISEPLSSAKDSKVATVKAANRFKVSQAGLTLEVSPNNAPTAEASLDTPTLIVPPNSPVTTAPPPTVPAIQSEAQSQESALPPTSEPTNASPSEVPHQEQQIQPLAPPTQGSVPRQNPDNGTTTSSGTTHNVVTQSGEGSNTRRSNPPRPKTPSYQNHTQMFYATMTTTFQPPPPEAPLKLQFPHTMCDLALGLSQIFAQKKSAPPAIIPTMKDANMPRSERGKLPLTPFQYLPSLFGREITQSYPVIAEDLCKRLEEVIVENPQLQSNNPETPSNPDSDPSNMQLYLAASNSPNTSNLRKPDLFIQVPEWFPNATTPCPSPVLELSFDRSMRPPKPRITREMRRTRHRGPINLAFPRQNRCVQWADRTKDGSSNEKPLDEAEKRPEEEESAFLIISIVDKTSTNNYPTEPYPDAQ